MEGHPTCHFFPIEHSEANMVALNISAHLRPDSFEEFTRVCQEEIHPALQEMKGFRGHLVLALPDGEEAITISFWDGTESVRARNEVSFKVVLALAPVIHGRPMTWILDLSNKICDNGEPIQSLAGIVDGCDYLQILKVSSPVFQRVVGNALVKDRYFDPHQSKGKEIESECLESEMRD